MKEPKIHNILRITSQENLVVADDFIDKEVYESIMKMDKNKAGGPDCFHIEFYQFCWEIIKDDLVNILTNDFSRFPGNHNPKCRKTIYLFGRA
jgi:hypothetical protein